MKARILKLLSEGNITMIKRTGSDFELVPSIHRILQYSDNYKVTGNDTEERRPSEPVIVSLAPVTNFTDRLLLTFNTVTPYTKYIASLYRKDSLGKRIYVVYENEITTTGATGSYTFTGLISNTQYFSELVVVDESQVTTSNPNAIVLSIASLEVSATTNNAVVATTLKAKIIASTGLKWSFSVDGAITANMGNLVDLTTNYTMVAEAPSTAPTDTPSIVAGNVGTGNVVQFTNNSNGHGLTMRGLTESLDATDGFAVLIGYEALTLNGNRRLFSFVDADNTSWYFRVETGSAGATDTGILRYQLTGTTDNVVITFDPTLDPALQKLFTPGWKFLIVHVANNLMNVGLYSGGTNGIGGTVTKLVNNRAVNPATFNYESVGWGTHINGSNITEGPWLGKSDLFTLWKSSSVGGATPGSGMPTYDAIKLMCETSIAE